jgi:hypothetical protein
MKRHGYWLWAPLRGYISEPSFLNCNHLIFIHYSIYILFQFCSSWFFRNIGIRVGRSPVSQSFPTPPTFFPSPQFFCPPHSPHFSHPFFSPHPQHPRFPSPRSPRFRNSPPQSEPATFPPSCNSLPPHPLAASSHSPTTCSHPLSTPLHPPVNLPHSLP